MLPVGTADFAAVLEAGSLREAPVSLGIGRELSFAGGPARQVVVHFSAEEPLQHLRDVTRRVLALEDEWLLLPRLGLTAHLGLLPGDISASAIRFEVSEQADLSLYLCTRPMDLDSASADLYAVAGSGTILITWDHHTVDEGLSIGLQRVSDASRLLAALNDLGAEMEVFYRAAPPWDA